MATKAKTATGKQPGAKTKAVSKKKANPAPSATGEQPGAKLSEVAGKQPEAKLPEVEVATQAPEAPEPVEMVKPVALGLDLVVADPGAGYRTRRVDVTLNGLQAKGMARILAGFRAAPVALRDGRLVSRPADVVRLICEKAAQD